MRGQVYNVPRGLVWDMFLGIAERESEEMAPKRERERVDQRERGRSLSESTLIMRTVLNITEIDFQNVIIEYLMVP